MFATERDDPLTKLALDVLGACLISHTNSYPLKGNLANEKLDKFMKACMDDRHVRRNLLERK